MNVMAKIRNNCYNKMIDAKLEIKGWPYWRPAPVFFNNQYCYKNIYYFRQQFITQEKKIICSFYVKAKICKTNLLKQIFFQKNVSTSRLFLSQIWVWKWQIIKFLVKNFISESKAWMRTDIKTDEQIKI